MKKIILDFLYRGLMVCSGGPIVLAIVYAILQKCGVLQTLTVNEVILGILTSALLTFIAGGINVVYKIEQLPLILAIFIHAVVLYLTYIIIYLTNDWLKLEFVPFFIFTICFIIGFAIIWMIVYFFIKKSTDRVNMKLIQYQKKTEGTNHD